MLSKIKDILVISTENDTPLFKKLLKDGSQWGCNIEYAVQKAPNGLAEAFIIGESFIGKDNVSMILGDNIFFGQSFSSVLEKSAKIDNGLLYLLIK